MANAKEIKRKIWSIKNTWKITKAMELISTVKMKKAQSLANGKKSFVTELLKVFYRIEDSFEWSKFFKDRQGDKKLIILITSNKGLCGGYNVNVMKEVNKYIKEWSLQESDLDFIALGKKWAQFVVRTGNNLVADFSNDFTDDVNDDFIKSISDFVLEKYLGWEYNEVVIFYNYFQNTMSQIVVKDSFLPIKKENIFEYLLKITGKAKEEIFNPWAWEDEYEIEPSEAELVDTVIPMVLRMMIYDKLLESKASEHSSRMIAMKNAKDSSKKIAAKLTLQYNKARQAAITREVSEIVSWVESMKD